MSYRYSKCKKCFNSLVTLIGESYSGGGHKKITSWFCMKCKTFYINPAINVRLIVVDDRSIAKETQIEMEIMTKERRQRQLGMI